MRRFLIPVVALLVLAAACGGGSKKEGQLTGADQTSSPGTSSSSAPGSSTSPGATAGPASTSGSSTGGASTAPDAGSKTSATTPKPAAQGGTNQPKPGQYIYAAKGSASDPLNPAAPQATYPPDAEVTHEISNNGNVTTDDRTSSEGTGVFTLRTRYEATRILLLSIDTNTPIGEFKCTFNPPLVIAHLPVKPETIPMQDFHGSGNACTGKLGITVVKKETVSDAKGKAWSTWQFKVHTEASGDQFSNTSDDVQWQSPDLGVSIRSTGTSHGWFKANAAGPKQNFTGSQSTVLKKYP